MKCRAEALVSEINRLDLPHRKGWRSSDFVGIPRTKHLDEEMTQLRDALWELREARSAAHLRPDRAFSARVHVHEELADVFACLLQIAHKLDISFEELDTEAMRKLGLTFIGADKIIESLR